MSDVFKALADPTRREILLMLAQKEASINTIAEKFSMSRPAVSKHIKILEEGGLLHIQPGAEDGRQRYCHAQLTALKEMEDYLQRLETFWASRLDRLGSFLEKNTNPPAS